MLHQILAIAGILISSASFAGHPLSITTLDPKPVVAGNRSVFMNGVDISSARNQDLRNVHIRVSENGDIFITAPQYQVTEEETYTPLSSYIPGQGRPTHQPPMEVGSEKSAGLESSHTPPVAQTVTPNPPPVKTGQAQPASPPALDRPAGTSAK